MYRVLHTPVKATPEKPKYSFNLTSASNLEYKAKALHAPKIKQNNNNNNYWIKSRITLMSSDNAMKYFLFTKLTLNMYTDTQKMYKKE